MNSTMSTADEQFIRMAVGVSRRALEDEGKTPFGAILVIEDEIVSEGTSSVVELRDPTAHAEVMALRNAGQRLGTHLFESATMYCSSEPCPMCLAACYWARVPRLIYAADSTDVAMCGFEDLQFYREIAAPHEKRSLKEIAAGGELRDDACKALREWVSLLPGGVEPKL